ncbi:hypothetical protein EDD11_000750 [Mortierella claussenii]|nr:hypothetical protein EDD11_000750 [Mortierella claussenii]
MSKSTASGASSSDADSTRCKAIAISTGQRCSRSGRLNGYCSEKHRQQADSTNGLWGITRQPGASPFTDSEGETHPVPANASKKKSKANKAFEALGIKKTADASDMAHTDPTPAPAPTSAPAPIPVAAASPKPAKPTKPTKSSPPAKKTPAAKKAPAKRSSRSKKPVIESSDEFEHVSDSDYKPPDSDEYDDSDSDFDLDDDDDDDDEDEDMDELSGKLATVKIKSDGPPVPSKSDSPSDPPKTRIKRTKSKIFNTDARLAPPKNKTKASSASGRPTGGFWVLVPPPVNIPESTKRILASVKDRLKSDDSSSDLVPAGGGPHDPPERKPSGFFKYRARVHNYLFSNDDDDNTSTGPKRAGVRQMFKSLFHKIKGEESDPETPYQKPLPQLPPGKTIGSGPKKSKPSGDNVDAVANAISDLSIKDEDDEVPNQCHGFNSNGHRCKRRVKLDRPIEKGEVLMCHDHEVNEDDEVVVHIEGKGGVLLQWMDLSSWVNPDLPDYVQNKLRKAMERPVSDTDKPGYIYAYQLVETRVTPTHTLFKVGRTDNVFRRMSEWSDKCGSPPRLIEVFPEQGSLAPRDENDLSETAIKIAGDNEVTGLRCRYAHRVERLIHIELKPLHDKDHICACKTNHREWFKVPHQPGLSDSQQMKQAWGQVRRVIVHWMAYMEHVYGPG